MNAEDIKIQKSSPVFNKRIVGFFLRLFILFSIWFVCYNLILKPSRVIDRPITNFLTASVTWCINVVSPNTAPISWAAHPEKDCAELFREGVSVFGIWDVCNGIDLMFIYAGILLLLPGPLKRKLIFAVAGVGVIILANVFRIAALYFIYNYQRSAFDFSHHYLFTLSMYILIVYGWLYYIKKVKLHEQAS